MAPLTESEFQATMDNMRPIEEALPLPDGFWAYFDSINGRDSSFEFAAGRIAMAYRNFDDSFHHVLIESEEQPEVFLAMVVRTADQSILGHRELDLPAIYGRRDQ